MVKQYRTTFRIDDVEVKDAIYDANNFDIILKGEGKHG